jgi:tetratricopeptide (TPR) repeat protein
VGEQSVFLTSQPSLDVKEATRLADQLVERIKTAEAHGIAAERVWAELGRPLLQVLERGGLKQDKSSWLGRFAGFREQLEGRVRFLIEDKGPASPETVKAMMELADLADEQNDLNRARELLEQAVESSRSTYGPDAEQTVGVALRLGVVMRDQGLLEDAERLQRDLVHKCEGAFGSEAPLTLSAKNNLATTLRALRGPVREVRELQEGLVAAAQKVFGAGDRRTWGYTMNLANTLQLQGDSAASTGLLEQVLQMQSSELGPSHPDTLLTTQNLASVLWQAGRRESARKLEREVFETTRRLLGARHPMTVVRESNLLVYLVNLGALDEARVLFHRDLEWLMAKDPGSLSLLESEARAAVERLLPELNP